MLDLVDLGTQQATGHAWVFRRCAGGTAASPDRGDQCRPAYRCSTKCPRRWSSCATARAWATSRTPARERRRPTGSTWTSVMRTSSSPTMARTRRMRWAPGSQELPPTNGRRSCWRHLSSAPWTQPAARRAAPDWTSSSTSGFASATSGSSTASPAGGFAPSTPTRRDAGRSWASSTTSRPIASTGAVVVCGGATKTIGAPDGRAFTVPPSAPGMAVSGSGDAQAGLVSGLLARGADPVQAAVWGAWLHARAGDRVAEQVGPLGFLARELAGEVPRLLAET